MEMEPTKKGKMMVKISGKMVDKNVSPIILLKSGGKKGCNKIVSMWMKNWTTINDSKEMEAYKKLIQQTCLRKCSSEIAVSMIFKLAPGFSAWAREPLLPKLGKLEMPVCVMLGDSDFLTWDGLPEYH